MLESPRSRPILFTFLTAFEMKNRLAPSHKHAPSDDGQNRARTASRSGVSKFFGFLFSQFIAFACLVGFPALVTAIAPVSWITFERHEGRVSFVGRTCLLFFVPYKTVTVDEVVGIDDRVVAGTVSRSGKKGGTRSEDQGYLTIEGRGEAAEVPVTPYNLDSVGERAAAFLEDATASELKLFVVANWKFSVIAGGCLSLLTVLYVFLVTFSVLLKAVHLVQRALGVPPQRRLWIRLWRQ